MQKQKKTYVGICLGQPKVQIQTSDDHQPNAWLVTAGWVHLFADTQQQHISLQHIRILTTQTESSLWHCTALCWCNSQGIRFTIKRSWVRLTVCYRMVNLLGWVTVCTRQVLQTGM